MPKQKLIYATRPIESENSVNTIYHNLSVILSYFPNQQEFVKTNEENLLIVDATPATEVDQKKVARCIEKVKKFFKSKLYPVGSYDPDDAILHHLNLLSAHSKYLPKPSDSKPGSPLPPESPSRRSSHSIASSRSESRASSYSPRTLFAAFDPSRRGVNVTSLALLHSPSSDKMAVEMAVRKDATSEPFLAHLIGSSLGKEDAAILVMDEEGEPKTTSRGIHIVQDEMKIYGFLGAINEEIAGLLSEASEYRLPVPMVARTDTQTVHAYASGARSFQDVCAIGGGEKKVVMHEEPTQSFLALQLVLGTMDCHGGNVLMKEERYSAFETRYSPIAIDLARSLGIDPLNPYNRMLACYLDFPALDTPWNALDRDFFATLPISETMQNIFSRLKENNAELIANEDFRVVIEKNLTHLHARLIVLQQAARADLNLRQISVLFFPVASLAQLAEYRKDAEMGADYLDIVSYHLKQFGFLKAWTQAKQLNGDILMDVFQESIRSEIETLKTLPKDQLFTQREKELYGSARMYKPTRVEDPDA